MYGKIIDGRFILAPNPLVSGGYKKYNPRPKDYEAEGYLEVIEIDYPEDEKYYEKHYVERDGKIYAEWVEAEAPEVPVVEPIPTLEERTSALEAEVDVLNESLNMILEGVTE